MQGTDSLHVVSEPGGRALRELSSAHCLLALPRGKLEMLSRERALTAFLFCLYVVLLYLMSCLLEFVSFTLALPIAILPTCKPSRSNRKLSIRTCTSSIIIVGNCRVDGQSAPQPHGLSFFFLPFPCGQDFLPLPVPFPLLQHP